MTYVWNSRGLDAGDYDSVVVNPFGNMSVFTECSTR